MGTAHEFKKVGKGADCEVARKEVAPASAIARDRVARKILESGQVGQLWK